MSSSTVNMDVEMIPVPFSSSTLKRSSSAPMINVLADNANSTLCTRSSAVSISEYPSVAFPSPLYSSFYTSQPRARRYSASFSPGSPHSAAVKIPSRIRQIKQEEGMDMANREVAHEKEIQSQIQISQSWEDLTLADSVADSVMEVNHPSSNTPKRLKSVTDPLHIYPCNSHFSMANSSPSPTRVGKQCFSPSMQAPIRNTSLSPSPTPSPTRKSFTTRRSLSPITLRPSQLSVKRKFDMDTDYANSPPKRFALTPERSLVVPHPLTHSLSSSSLESGVNSPDQRVPHSNLVELSMADSGSTCSSDSHSPISAFKPVEVQQQTNCHTGNAHNTLV